MTALCAQTGTDRRTRACLARVDGSCGPCGLGPSATITLTEYYEAIAGEAYKASDDAVDRFLAWLGGLLILLSAALVLVGLPWLIVAVVT